MRDENVKAVDALREKIRVKEDEVRQLKTVINGFYTDEGEPAPYANTSPDSSTVRLGSLRTDHFYNKTLAEAAQEYLEMRKASGLSSASVNDIFSALKSGGYKFQAANDEYAKNGVRISLRKTGNVFHQLPNGDYGLCVWYGLKGKNEDAPLPRKKVVKHRKKQAVPAIQPKDPPVANEAQRLAHGIAGNGGVITVGTLEDFIRAKSRRMAEIVEHFHVNETTIKSLINEPTSKVYEAGRGWIKVRE
jgi:hypothetical protein